MDWMTVEVETESGTYTVFTVVGGWQFEPDYYEGEVDYSGTYPDMQSAISGAYADGNISHTPKQGGDAR